MTSAFRLLVLATAMTTANSVDPAGITGQWTEPTGSVINIDQCGAQLCMWVVTISPVAPADVDIYNPDATKRHRSLCGLQIGHGFEVRGAGEAGNGTLYDPKSGKTYHGNMKRAGDKLLLRGYVGIPLFGVTQTWSRPAKPVAACSGKQNSSDR